MRLKAWKSRNWLAVLVSVVLLSGGGPDVLVPAWTVQAVETKNTQSTEKTTQSDEPEVPTLGEGEAGILIEGKTGNVLFAAHSQKRMFPASTTKVMTALVALDALHGGEVTLEEEVEITPEMLEGLAWDGSNMALKEGERISMERLLQGLMIPSGNDAAMAIAYRISGSQEAFVERMNRKAEGLGLKDTHFVNPHGLHDENHYTTVADMAEIARAAMENEIFRNIVDIAHIKMPPTNKTPEQRYYINTNGLVSTMRYTDFYYPKATGIKTGHTSQAGNCLVASAESKGMELISVLFHGKEVSDSHLNSIKMLEYGFSAYEQISAISKNQIVGEIRVKQAKRRDSVTLSALEQVAVVVPKGTAADRLEFRLNLPESLKAPLAKGEEVGTVSVLLDGQELGEGKICADIDVQRSFFWPALALGEWLWGFRLIRGICYLVLTVLGGFLLLVVIGVFREIKRVRRVNQRRRQYRRRK